MSVLLFNSKRFLLVVHTHTGCVFVYLLGIYYLGRSERKLQETRGNCVVSIFKVGTKHQILLGWSNEEDEMGGECSAYGGEERCV